MSNDYTIRLSEIANVIATVSDPLGRSKRLFLEEPSHSTKDKRDVEFDIKQSVSKLFAVPYSEVRFCGSAHLGISPIKGTAFVPGQSDLDLAVVSPKAFTKAFEELSGGLAQFSDLTPLPNNAAADRLKQRIWKSGSIHLSDMPSKGWAFEKKQALAKIGRKHSSTFSSITIAFYISEYFYCWKQNSAISIINSIGI